MSVVVVGALVRRNPEIEEVVVGADADRPNQLLSGRGGGHECTCKERQNNGEHFITVWIELKPAQARQLQNLSGRMVH